MATELDGLKHQNQNRTQTENAKQNDTNVCHNFKNSGMFLFKFKLEWNIKLTWQKGKENY